MVYDMAQKILVVDDEEGIVLLLKDYFELQGYEVITAGGGMEALDRISCDPDMIILDINMPDLDGLSVCRKIREKVKSNTPIQKNALSGGAGARRFLLWVITHRVQDSWTRHFYFFCSFCFFLRFIRYTLQKAFKLFLLPSFTERNRTCFITDHRTGSFMMKNIGTGLSGRIMRIFTLTASVTWGTGRLPRILPRRRSSDS